VVARDEAATVSSNVDASVGRLSASQTAPVKGARSGGQRREAAVQDEGGGQETLSTMRDAWVGWT
jgi:hypothetical protein